MYLLDICFDSLNRGVLSWTTLGSQPSHLLTARTHGGQCLKKLLRELVVNLLSQRYFRPLRMLATSGRLVYQHSVSLLWQTHQYCSTITTRFVPFYLFSKDKCLRRLPSHKCYMYLLAHKFHVLHAVPEQRRVHQRNWDIRVDHQGAGHSQRWGQRRRIKGRAMRWPYPASMQFLQLNWFTEIMFRQNCWLVITCLLQRQNWNSEHDFMNLVHFSKFKLCE